MNIQELMSNPEYLMQQTDPELVHLEGAVFAEENGAKVRVYGDPKQTSRYFLLNSSDIVGDVTPLSKEYLESINLVGFPVFRLSVKRGTSVQYVSISVEKLGETVEAPTAGSKKNMSPGDCHATSGCTSGCCTEAENGRCVCNRCCIA